MARSFRGMSTVRKSAEEAAKVITSERIIMVEDEKIIDNPLNNGLPMGDMYALADSLKRTNGPIEPAVVWDLKDGRYMLVSGHRRRYAWCKILGNKTLRCSIREYPDDPRERFLMHASANTQTREKDPFFWVSEIKHARALLADTGFEGSEAEEKQEIYRLLGEGASPVQIARYEGFAKLEPELQDLCRFGLSASTLYNAVRLTPEEQRNVASAVETHYADKNAEELSRDDFITIVRAEKNARNENDNEKKDKPKSATWSVKVTRLEGNLIQKLKSAKTEEEKESARMILTDLKEQIRLVEEMLGFDQ